MPIDFTQLPDKNPDPNDTEAVETIRQGAAPTTRDRMLSVFRKSPKETQAKAQNAVAISENFGIPIHKAYDYHDDISKELGLQGQPSTPELIAGMFAAPITVGLATNPIGVMLGLAAFEALGEAESAAISYAKDEKYQMFQKKGFTSLLPEDANSITETTVDILDFMWKAKAAKGFFDKSPQIRKAITKKIIEEHGMPKEYHIDPADLRTELVGSKSVLPKEITDIYKELGVSGAEVKAALKNGMTIRVPAENITIVKDRPWFAAIKKILKIDPAQESRVVTKGEPEIVGGSPKKPKVPETPKQIGAPDTIPKMKSTNDAIKVGKAATPEQIETLKERYISTGERVTALKESGDLQGAMDLAVENQFNREAWEAAEGTLNTPEVQGPTKTDLDMQLAESKIRDDSGELLTVYHHTSTAFDKFKVPEQDPDPSGQESFGIYFSPNPGGWGTDPGTHIVPVHLNIKNPKIVDIDYSAQVSSDFLRELEAEGYDGLIGTDYDGSVREYVVFDPEQIVSTFDPGLGTNAKPENRDFENNIDSARGQDKPAPKASTAGVTDPKSLEIKAVEKVSREIGLEVRARDTYIKKLKADAEAVKSGAVKFAETTLNDDSEYMYDIRVVQEELAIFEKLVGGKDKSPRRTIRKNTGQVKVQDLVTVDERTALRDQIRFEAKAARDAFRAGKKEAALAAKVRQKELLERQRENRKLKAKVVKLTKTIRKKIPASVDFSYREAIDILREGIDPFFRSKKTMKNRERLAEFIKNNPESEANIPKKLLREMNKKPLGEYTIEDLETIAAQIESLIKLGKLKRTLKIAKRKREFAEAEAGIVDTIFNGEPLDDPDVPVVRSTSKRGKVSKSRRAVRATTLRPSRVADKLDGHQEFHGPVHQFFIDTVNRATNARLRVLDSRRGFMEEGKKDLGLSLGKLVSTREIDGVKFTVDEMIDVYIKYKNERGALAMQFGNNIPPELHDKIVASLTPEEIRLGDLILQEYEDNFSRLREAVIDIENRDMGHEENYSPLKRTDVDYTTSTQEVVDEILHRAGMKKAYAQKGMTLKRIDIPEEYQKPIRLGAYKTWLSTIEMQEQYIHFSQLIKDMHRMLEGDMKVAIEHKGGAIGSEYTKAMRNYVDRVANPNFYKTFGFWETASRQLRTNVAMAYLAGNLLTMGKQFPSLMFYLPDAGPIALAASLAEFTANPTKVWNFVAENDPQVKHRQIERELEEIRKLSGNPYDRIKAKVGEVGMFGIRLLDRTAITIGWNAVYQAHVRELGHDGAAKMAQDVTLRTQPQAAAKDLPDLYATSEFLNWPLQFTNQLNQIYNMATHDIRGQKAGKAILTALALAMSAMWIWMIQNKRLPKDEEDIGEALTDQAINAIPLVGKTVSQATKGWGGGGEIPPLKGVEDIVKGISDADVEDILKGVAPLTGFPIVATKRTGKFLKNGKPIELIGGKPKK